MNKAPTSSPPPNPEAAVEEGWGALLLPLLFAAAAEAPGDKAHFPSPLIFRMTSTRAAASVEVKEVPVRAALPTPAPAPEGAPHAAEDSAGALLEMPVAALEALATWAAAARSSAMTGWDLEARSAASRACVRSVSTLAVSLSVTARATVEK